MRLSTARMSPLNADSAIETDYTTEERRIVLKKGSAVFDVAHAPSRPFIVQVDNVTATALGTIYEVDRLESGCRSQGICGRCPHQSQRRGDSDRRSRPVAAH